MTPHGSIRPARAVSGSAFLLLILVTLPGCFTGITFTVNALQDAVDAAPGDGVCATAAKVCSLRAAIQEANKLPGSDIILVPAGTYQLSLAEPSDGGITGGDLDVTDTLWIRGLGVQPSVVDAGGLYRVFDLYGGFVRLDDIEIRDGDADEGGGIRVDAAALVWGFGLDIRANLALTNGAGIMNRGRLVLFDSQIRDNHVAARGGGIETTTLAITTLWNSTVSGNSANHGGGMHTTGLTYLFNSTVSGDSASASSGGIFNSGVITIANSTIAFNKAVGKGAEDAGGVRNYEKGVVIVRNSIIARNINPNLNATDCAGTLDSQGYNLVEDITSCTLAGTTTGNIIGQNPLLDPLAVYSFGTPTHRLQARSPAIDAGHPNTPGTGPPACWAEDQRGVVRQKCDIGAYERN